MKFGKELQKVIEMSDPDWAPYWPNYKVLKVSCVASAGKMTQAT
jgi:hypothetical protein